MKYLLIAVLFCLFCNLTIAQQVIPLYEGPVPNDNPEYKGQPTQQINVKRNGKDTTTSRLIKYSPTLTIYQPSGKLAKQAHGMAMVVIPGGGYYVVATTVEGTPVAERLVKEGITVFVLNYRLPIAEVLLNKEIVPMQDGQRALQYVRENARKYNINPDNIGVMGFSAGGHLASTIATHFDSVKIDNPKHTSLRPDFAVLVYPVISFKENITHQGSKMQLIGPEFKPELVQSFSNELQVTPQTPPIFIVHAIDDGTVKVENSLLFIAACQQNHVPVEAFIYEKGGHGFSINNRKATAQWIDNCLIWMKKNNWMKK